MKTAKKYLLLSLAAAVVLLAVGGGAYLAGRGARLGETQEESAKRGLLTEERTEISGEIIESSLSDIGELATEEYRFKQVESYDSSKSATIFSVTFDLPLTRSKFIYSYDGVIKAGVDFSAIRVEKDDAKRLLTVTVPKAHILSSEIDFDSFELYDEQSSIFNPVSVRDVHDTNQAMLRAAEKDAIAKGLLERADDNAETLLKNLLRGGYDVREYAIRLQRAG